MLMKNLQLMYHDKLFYQSISTFEELFEIGTRIEDAVREGRIKKEEPPQQSKRPNYSRSPMDVNALSSQPMAYPPRPYQPPHQSQPSNHQNKRPRKFSALDIPLSVALERLLKKGHLHLLPPKLLPNPLPPYFNTSLRCAYHQTSGHSTDQCFKLRHDIQDLIDRKIIDAPPARPSVTQNPLPKHRNINLIESETLSFDPSTFITPLGQPLALFDIPEDSKICLVEENNDWFQELEDE